MKYSVKILLTLILTLIFHYSYSQNKVDQKLYIKELKSIFKDSKNNNLELMFLNIDGTYSLPAYFTNYKEYIQKINFFGQNKFWYTFEETKVYEVLLQKSDVDELNIGILNDTNRLYINKNWFSKYKINILSDSITKKRIYSGDFMTPIFFNNYTRCFIAILDSKSMDSFFLKKIKGKWVFDSFYQRYEID
jgi:hypothetical protein